MFAVLTSARNLPHPDPARREGGRPAPSGLLRRLMRTAGVGAAALWLAACEPITMAAPERGPQLEPDAPIRVALLVPGGSGQSGDTQLATSLENAARLAVSDLSGVRVDLRVYNTAGSAERAAQQASLAVSEGAQIILGPVFSDSARAAGQAVAGSNVSVLSFSNNPNAAGGNVFIMGPTFENTARRLASYAQREGKGSVLAVYERNESGEIGRRAIQQGVSAAGGTMAGVEGFDFSQQGVVEAVPRIADMARSNAAQSIFFTSNSAGALPLLMQLLPENGVRPQEYQFIGLTRWDIPPATLELSGVQGGWFALPDPSLTAQFNARYRGAFGRDPHPIAALAYDGIAAVGALARSGRSDPLGRSALTQASGFAGVNGAFRLRPDGTNERGLAVAQIRDSQVIVIDPAPRSFVGPGF